MKMFFRALFSSKVVVTSKEKLGALKEALADTGVGAAINVPINFFAVWLAFNFEWGPLLTSIFLTIIFTVIAIIRKVIIRIGFLKLSRMKETGGENT